MGTCLERTLTLDFHEKKKSSEEVCSTPELVHSPTSEFDALKILRNSKLYQKSQLDLLEIERKRIPIERIESPAEKRHFQRLRSRMGDGTDRERRDLEMRSLSSTSSKHEAGYAQAEEERIEEFTTGWRLALVLSALLTGVFCIALDETIIATAIPAITEDFHQLNDVGSYGSGYLLTICAFQLFYGKLYNILSI